jgi:predicted Zn-dependent protease
MAPGEWSHTAEEPWRAIGSETTQEVQRQCHDWGHRGASLMRSADRSADQIAPVAQKDAGEAKQSVCDAAKGTAVRLAAAFSNRCGTILAINFRWEDALETGRAAVAANPSFGETRHGYADVLVHAGDAEEAVRQMRLELSLDPFHLPTGRALLGRAPLLSGRPAEAFTELQFCALRAPDYQPAQQMLVVAAVETGRMAEARAALREVGRLVPGLTAERLTENWFFRDGVVAEQLPAGFRAAGLEG